MEQLKHSADNTDLVYSNEEVSVLRKAACMITERFINDYWDEIERVAMELLKKETLTEDEVKRIIYPNAPRMIDGKLFVPPFKNK